MLQRAVVPGLFCAILVGACGGGDRSFATRPGDSVMSGAVTEVAIDSLGGGFGQRPAPAGAACDPSLGRFDVTLGPAVFSWVRCNVTGDGSAATDFVPAPGMLTLTPSQLDTVRAELAAVIVSSRTACGADKETLALTVFQGSDKMVYGDDFYACQMLYAHYVETAGLDALVATLAPLVRN